MSVTSGPKIINDSLEFYYDMYNKKSNLGAYTVNLFPTSILSATNASMEITSYPFYNGIYNGWKTTGISNDNPRTYLYDSALTVSANIFYSLSCLYWSSNNQVDDVYLQFSDAGWTESTYYIRPFTSQSVTRNGSFSIQDLGGGWKRCVGTFQTLATTTTLQRLFFDNDFAGVEIFITNIQLEAKDFASRYVNGSRTTTNVLKDLSNPKNAASVPSLTSLTFNNDEINTFTFDGSNDYINVAQMPVPTSWTAELFTVECILRVPAGGTWSNGYAGLIAIRGTGPGTRGMARSATNNQIQTWLRGSAETVTASATITRDTWYHVVSSWNGSVAKIYLNGSLESSSASSTLTGVPDNASLQISRAWTIDTVAGNAFGGDIALCRWYTRVLTDEEILNNFNAHRKFYGL